MNLKNTAPVSTDRLSSISNIDEIMNNLTGDKRASKLTVLAVESLLDAIKEQRVMILELESQLKKKVSRSELDRKIKQKAGKEEITEIINKSIQKKYKGKMIKKLITLKFTEEVGDLEDRIMHLESKMEDYLTQKEHQQHILFKQIYSKIESNIGQQVAEVDKKANQFNKIVKLCDSKDALLKNDFQVIQNRLRLIEEDMKLLELKNVTQENDLLSQRSKDFEEFSNKIIELKSQTDHNLLMLEQVLHERTNRLINQKLEEMENGRPKALKVPRIENLKKAQAKTTLQLKKVTEGLKRLENQILEIQSSQKEFKEDLHKKSFINQDEISRSLGQQLGGVVENLSLEISVISEKVQILMNDQEELCKESSNLLTNICLKEKQGDERHAKLVKRLEKIEEFDRSIIKKFDDSNQKKVTKADLNEYYIQMRQEIKEKVGLHEVQLALNEMQGKLEKVLIKSNQENYHAINLLKRSVENSGGGGGIFGPGTADQQRMNIDHYQREFSKNSFKGLGAAGFDREARTGLGANLVGIVQNRKEGRGSKIDNVAGKGLTGQDSVALIVEEIEKIKEFVDTCLTRDEFERFEVKKKDQENELKRLLGLKMDRKEFETSASQKAEKEQLNQLIDTLDQELCLKLSNEDYRESQKEQRMINQQLCSECLLSVYKFKGNIKGVISITKELKNTNKSNYLWTGTPKSHGLKIQSSGYYQATIFMTYRRGDYDCIQGKDLVVKLDGLPHYSFEVTDSRKGGQGLGHFTRVVCLFIKSQSRIELTLSEGGVDGRGRGIIFGECSGVIRLKKVAN